MTVRALTWPDSISCWVTPTAAISGRVNTAVATVFNRNGETPSPKAWYMAIRPCIAATDARGKRSVQSPAAYTPGTFVRDTRSTLICPEGVVSIPMLSTPMFRVLGIEPTVMSACDPRISRPSLVRTNTPPSSMRTTESTRACFTRDTPRSVNTVSSTSAASASSCGKIRSRDATIVTFTPSSANADTNSAPVTPEPTTIKCSGNSVML